MHAAILGKIDGDHTIFEIWDRRDRAGWSMHRYDAEEGEFYRYYHTQVCDPGEVRLDWRDAFMDTLDPDA